MAIFIGYDMNGKVISVISAKTEYAANAYWQGKGDIPHSQTKFDIEDQRENEELGFITPIVETKEIEVKTTSSLGFFKIRTIK